MGNGLNTILRLHAPLTTTESTYTTYCAHRHSPKNGGNAEALVSRWVSLFWLPLRATHLRSIGTKQVRFTFSYLFPSPLIKGFRHLVESVPPVQDWSTTAGEEVLPHGAKQGLQAKHGVILFEFQEEHVSVAEGLGEGGLGPRQLGFQGLRTLQQTDTLVSSETNQHM